MSSAEMTIRLVDGSEAEQAAFNRGPDDHETSNVPSVGGIDTGSSQRSEAVEAIAAGFATITDQEAKDNSQHDTTATVAAMHEQFAAITNGKQDDKPANQQGDPSDTQTGGPTTEDYRGYRVALEQLVQRFTPKFFSEPIDRLISALAPPVQTKENRETQAGPPPVQTTENRAPIIPAVGHVVPEQDEGDTSKTTADGKPYALPAVGQVAPTAAEKQTDTPKPVSVGDIVSNVQQRIARIPVVGKRINGAINAVRSTASKLGGFSKVAKSITGAIGKTKTGKAFLASGSKVAGRVAGSSFGKAVAGAGRSVVGAVARSVGATAAGGAVVSGGTSAATAVAAGGTAAAGSGAATVAAAAPLLANPVGLAVGAVVASFAAVALSAKALNDTFTSEADRLEQYSVKIAIARGNRQITTELNMMDRAKKIDGPLGSVETSKAALNSQMEKLWTEILTVLVKLSPLLETGVNSLSVVTSATREQVATIQSLSAMIQTFAATLTPGQADDKAAQNATNAAAKSLADAQKDLTEALGRLLGNNQGNAGMQGDPFLLSLLNARP